ncbi:family 20 glycosylhydrolase [Arthrobacter sp. SDTb3-6]|uniref:family 20 glycosylhydrolase n=1 Tax=Arthrobacter sp. SDTb3-6 TaxID=2713571 RepID=UPI00159E4B67|nr:family 20 glycosylhydrolase [Arthrobacter sp. SDTb3-6]NVM98219.1 family 20 glycosylhydrolase [Arthrobacter sp. SDTb3-6]
MPLPVPGADAHLAAAPTVIPSLQHWTPGEGGTRLGEGFVVVHPPELAEVAATLLADMAELAGLSGSAGDGAGAGTIVLALDPALEFPADNATAAAEGYVLEVDGGVRVSARTAAGVYWGTRSLLQMLSASTTLPGGTAVDWPNYPVRGFMLDVGRRFADPAALRDWLRFMSWYKLNTFLVHLNDNEITSNTQRPWTAAQQAFRLASDSPWLAGLAAEDGSYSRADWDSFEDEAALRQVRLVPEIDVPAHARSFTRWRPEMGLDGGDSDMLDLGRPATTELVKDVFSEFVPWFRGPAVHFGADEYARGHSEEYRAFFNAISAHVRALGKDPMAWGSLTVMSGGAGAPGPDGYSRDVVVCAWNKDWYSGRAAVADGYRVINTDDALLYIVPFADYYHGHGLDARALFDSWEPHVFGDGLDLEPRHPQLLGAASAVWNDLVLLAYNERAVHDLVKPAFGVLAQKMWAGAVAGLSFEEFTAQARAVARWPGRELLD